MARIVRRMPRHVRERGILILTVLLLLLVPCCFACITLPAPLLQPCATLLLVEMGQPTSCFETFCYCVIRITTVRAPASGRCYSNRSESLLSFAFLRVLCRQGNAAVVCFVAFVSAVVNRELHDLL